MKTDYDSIHSDSVEDSIENVFELGNKGDFATEDNSDDDSEEGSNENVFQSGGRGVYVTTDNSKDGILILT